MAATTTKTNRKDDLVNKLEQMGARPYNVGVLATTVTPEMAALLLEHNYADNRNLKEESIKRYMQDMIAGTYLVNGSSLLIDKAGNLVDGQNRCVASVRSGKSFPAVIISGVDTEVYSTVDIGKPKNIKDMLKKRGVTGGHLDRAAAAVRVMRLWDNGVRNMSLGRASNSGVPMSDMLQYFDENQEEILSESVRPSATLTTFLPPRVATVIKILTRRAVLAAGEDPSDPNGDYQVFWRALETGRSDSELLILLRETLLRNKSQEKNNHPADQFYWQLGVVLKNWNAWRAGDTNRKMAVRFNPGGANPQLLPERIL